MPRKSKRENAVERLQPIIPSELDWAYVAAMVDGEGSLSLTMTYNTDRKGQLYPAFDCKTDISNTSKDLMQWIQRRFGGKVYLSTKHISKKARANGQKSMKPCYRWYCDGQEHQQWFVSKILPLLVIKKKQAELVLEYVQIKRNGRKGARKERMDLHEKLKALNKVGESLEANMLNTALAVKKESELCGDVQSGPTVTLEAATAA